VSTPAPLRAPHCAAELNIDPAIAPQWRDLTDEDREREYSPSSRTGGSFAPFIEHYVQRSEAARAAAAADDLQLRVLRYGEAESQTIDVVVPATSNADQAPPILVYIHGGYWQLLSKRESFFAAPDALANGWAFAAVDYTLAPHATLDEIVSECKAAVAAVRDHAGSLAIGPDRIYVCGSSAGAHLSAMVALGLDDGWRPAGVGLISGVFELEPLIGTSINDAVQLDLAAAHRNSPMLQDLADFPPALLAWGDNETDEFKRQSRSFSRLLRGAGTASVEMEIADRNHFDVVFDLCDAATTLGAEMAALVNRTASSDTL